MMSWPGNSFNSNFLNRFSTTHDNPRQKNTISKKHNPGAVTRLAAPRPPRWLFQMKGSAMICQLKRQKGTISKRKLIFHAWIFRGYVSFLGTNVLIEPEITVEYIVCLQIRFLTSSTQIDCGKISITKPVVVYFRTLI